MDLDIVMDIGIVMGIKIHIFLQHVFLQHDVINGNVVSYVRTR